MKMLETRKTPETRRSRRSPILAAIAAALSLLAAAPAAAEVLVSNIGQSKLDGARLSSSDLAQGFRTGGNAAGYTLRDVAVSFQEAPGSDLTVKIATGLPSATTVVATLTNPSSLTAGDLTFTAPANTTLSANTTYWVVLEGSGRIWQSPSDGEVGQADWRVSNDLRWRTSSSTGAWTGTASQVMLISVNGPEVAPGFSSATVNGAALKITFDEDLVLFLTLLSQPGPVFSHIVS